MMFKIKKNIYFVLIFSFTIFCFFSSFAMDKKHKDAKEKENNNYELSIIFQIYSQLFDKNFSDKNIRLTVLSYIDDTEDFLEKIKIIQSQPFDELYALNKELNSKFNLDKLLELENKCGKGAKVLVSAFIRGSTLLDKYFEMGMPSCALDCSVNSRLLDNSKVAVTIVAFSPDGKYIVWGLANNKLKLYDLTNRILSDIGKEIQHSGFINSVQFYEDGKKFVTACKDKICFWDIANLKQPSNIFTSNYNYGLHNFIEKEGCKINFIKIIYNDLMFVSTDKGTFFLTTRGFGANSWVRRKLLENQTINIDCLITRWHDRFLTSDDKDVIIYEQRSGFGGCALDSAHSLPICDSKNLVISLFSPSGVVLTGYYDGIVKLWNVEEFFTKIDKGIAQPTILNPKIQQISQWTAHCHSINSAKFSKDGNYLVTGSRDCTFKIWNLIDPKLPSLIKTFNANDNAIFSVDFSPDNKYIAAGTWANGIRLWDIDSANILSDLNMAQLGFIIKFFNNFSEEDISKPIFNSLNDKIKRYLYRIIELRKRLSSSDGSINKGLNYVLEYLGSDLHYDYQVNNQKCRESSSCVIS